MARLPFGGAGYHIGALVRGVSMVENRLNEERHIFVQEEVVKPMDGPWRSLCVTSRQAARVRVGAQSDERSDRGGCHQE